jgi:hypothetical protein
MTGDQNESNSNHVASTASVARCAWTSQGRQPIKRSGHLHLEPAEADMTTHDRSRYRLRALLAAGILTAITLGPARALGEDQLTIEKLLKDGWTVAGYAAQRTTFILLKHESRPFLVQCSILYDTTRGAATAERVQSNCYELH